MRSLYRWFMNKRQIEVRDIPAVKDTPEKIFKYFKDDFKRSVVIVCIGTNRTDTVDCLGPFVGSMLREDRQFNIPVYGSMVEPINALNIATRIKEINKIHPESSIIAIDACLSNRSSIGSILISDEPIQAGRGLGKCYGMIGDKCIKGVVGAEGFDVAGEYADLGFINDMARTIVTGLKMAVSHK